MNDKLQKMLEQYEKVAKKFSELAQKTTKEVGKVVKETSKVVWSVVKSMGKAYMQWWRTENDRWIRAQEAKNAVIAENNRRIMYEHVALEISEAIKECSEKLGVFTFDNPDRIIFSDNYAMDEWFRFYVQRNTYAEITIDEAIGTLQGTLDRRFTIKSTTMPGYRLTVRIFFSKKKNFIVYAKYQFQ